MVANLALTVVSLTVVFGAAEGALAWRDWRWRARFEDSFHGRILCTTAADDARLIYTLRPNACASNSKGYPDAEASARKADGVFRVVVIGDSVAAGQGVAREERFAARLAPNSAGRRLEVIVLARPGYSTSQELVILESEAFSYQPDLVIWVYCLNDPADPIYHDANGELGRYYYRPRSYTLHYLRKLFFKARENCARRDCGEDYHEVLHCVYRAQVASNIGAIGGLARSHDTPVLFAIVPVFDRDPTTLEGVHQQLAAAATQAGLVPVDLLPLFRDAPPGRFAQQGPTGPDPWHANAAGNAMIAEGLTRELQRFLAAPQRATPGSASRAAHPSSPIR
jgi:lysophospholipase L1-like esterase